MEYIQRNFHRHNHSRNTENPWRQPTLWAALVSALVVGCATEPSSVATITSEGLHRAPSPRGLLLVRDNHNIGGYDEIHFPAVTISFASGHKGLRNRDATTLRENLEERLHRRSTETGIVVASEPKSCAMSMGFSISDLEVSSQMSRANASSALLVHSMGAVTLEVVIRDSKTDTVLLRFKERRRLSGISLGDTSHNKLVPELENALDAILADFGARMFEVIPQTNAHPSLSEDCQGRIRTIGATAEAA